MIKTELQERNSAATPVPQGKLSIRIGVDSFAYAYLDPVGQVNFIRAYQWERPCTLDQIKRVIQSDKIFSLGIQNILIGWASKPCVLIPAKLFDLNNIEVYLSSLLSDGDSDGHAFDHQSLPSLASQLVYQYPLATKRYLSELFNKATVGHLVTYFLKSTQSHARKFPEGVVYVLAYAHFIRIAVYKGGILQLTNQFAYRSAPDFLYYTLLGFDQFALAADDTPVFLAGSITVDSAIYRLLYRYIKSLSFFPDDFYPELGPQIQKGGPHLYADILMQAKF